MNNVVHVTFGHSVSELFAKACKIDDHDPDEAIRLYRRAIHLDPGCSEAMTNLGRLYFNTNAHGAAETWWERAIKANPRAADAYYNLAYLRLIRKDYRGAITYFEMSISIEPSFADAHYNLAEALWKLGRCDEARTCLRTHVKLRGSWSVEALEQLGLRLVK